MTESFLDKRQRPRRPWRVSLEFLRLGEKLQVIASGNAVDLSDSGAAVISDFSMLTGQVVIFREKENPYELKFCTAAWSRKDGGLYTAGLKFI